MYDRLEAKMSEDSLTKGHGNRTVCSQRNDCTVFRRVGAREWPDRFALLDGNLIVLGKFIACHGILITELLDQTHLQTSPHHETTTGVARHQ